MANLDLSKATANVYMYSVNHVGFGVAETTAPTLWSYFTPAGADLELIGQNMTYDVQGHALSGTVSSITIDLGNNDLLNPDVAITGINVAASTLDDDVASFWRFLEGNDVITLPVAATSMGAGFWIFGDGLAARAGAPFGGNDAINYKDVSAYVAGDVIDVGTQAAGAATVRYQGGADRIHGSATNRQQLLVGDAAYVHATGRLTGGSDNIFIQSANVGSWAVGEAELVGGMTGDLAEVIGGDDYIAAGVNSRAALIGDVYRQVGSSSVRGGNDELVGGEQGELIVGDVYDVGGDRLTGGDDTIWGNGGNDTLVGDARTVASNGKVVAGNDTIYGGDGADVIYGDTINGNSISINVTGGNDELHGEAGDDILVGGTGDDFLLGGTGKDQMYGDAGNDTYVVDNAADVVFETNGQGIDKVFAQIAEITLGNNVENLSSLWTGDFMAFGNVLNNTMSAGGGDDYLDGRAGNDVLVGYSGRDSLVGNEGNDTLNGGAGADYLYGGDGADIASYDGAAQGVKMALDASFASEGDAMGDMLFSIERLTGSDYRDVLRGDGGANVLTGGAGNDTLQGAGGNDVIIGGIGSDTLNGGAGNDRFDFLALSDGGDAVADFGNAAGNDDALRFDGSVFGGLAAGALAASRFVANAAGAATSLDQRFVYETDTGILRYDANGSAAGGVTVIATLTGTPAFTAGDILII